jgi:hypothetical protein
MMGEAIGVDLEAACVFGNSTYTSGGNKDPLFSCFDGWLKGATAVKSDGAKGSGSADFVLANTGVVGMFDAMLKKLPAAYRQANLMKDLVFYVPYEVYEAYRAFLIDRETGLGDSTLLNADELKYKGIPVKYAPVLDAADGRTVYGKVPSILTVPEFLWYGVYKDLSVEPHRDVANEKTDYYYRIRCDAANQWTDAVIAAQITAAEAAAL